MSLRAATFLIVEECVISGSPFSISWQDSTPILLKKDKVFMKAYSSIEERIQILEDQVAVLNAEIEVLKTPPTSHNERIILKYIETGSTGKTKDFVRKLGIKSARGLFSSGDVTRLIKDGAEDISPALLKIARQLASGHNKNGPSR